MKTAGTIAVWLGLALFAYGGWLVFVYDSSTHNPERFAKFSSGVSILVLGCELVVAGFVVREHLLVIWDAFSKAVAAAITIGLLLSIGSVLLTQFGMLVSTVPVDCVLACGGGLAAIARYKPATN